MFHAEQPYSEMLCVLIDHSPKRQPIASYYTANWLYLTSCIFIFCWEEILNGIRFHEEKHFLEKEAPHSCANTGCRQRWFYLSQGFWSDPPVLATWTLEHLLKKWQESARKLWQDLCGLGLERWEPENGRLRVCWTVERKTGWNICSCWWNYFWLV